MDRRQNLALKTLKRTSKRHSNGGSHLKARDLRPPVENYFETMHFFAILNLRLKMI